MSLLTTITTPFIGQQRTIEKEKAPVFKGLKLYIGQHWTKYGGRAWESNPPFLTKARNHRI
jgi:hypothetical protein